MLEGTVLMVLPLAVFSAVLWVADIFVPTEGYWIFLKMITADGKIYMLGGAILFIFCMGMVLLGTKIPIRVQDENLPAKLIVGGAVAATVGILLAVVMQ
ncbi:MAG: hypothetical protein AAB815_00610, partial [Patescibacteria group bacterium]